MRTLNFETISIELTKYCNLSCAYCYACATNDPNAPIIDLSKLFNFFHVFKKNGGRRILLTGGEICLVKELKEIIKCAKEYGLLVDLFSNGTLINDDLASFISKNVNLINISLDGPEEHHDLYRCVKGSYKKTLQALEYLKVHKAHVALQCMVTPYNFDQIGWLHSISDICDPIIIKLGHVSKMGRGTNKTGLMIDDYDKLKETAQILMESYNHFHTRIVTNIISLDELKIFYPNFNMMVTPWLLPDGRILSCYVNNHQDYWTLSTLESYPYTSDESYKRRKILIEKAYEKASTMGCFDVLQLLSETAEEIAKTNESICI
jgi:MoaA/NifB/PqqE/SkfB family radical SAM enzyme